MPKSTLGIQECLNDNKDTLYMLQHGREQRYVVINQHILSILDFLSSSSSLSFGLLCLDILAFVGVDFVYSPLLGGNHRCRDLGVLFVFVCLINFLFFGGSFTVWL